MGIISEIPRYLPDFLKPMVRKFYYTYVPHLYLVNTKHKNDLIPPKRLAILYGADEAKDFTAIGDHLLTMLTKYAELKSNSAVLDVGCGTGLMAVALTSYLKNGSYEGFDTIPAGIKWCQNNISERFPNFHFQVADIYNESYNPRGKIQSINYRFPYEDSSFDVVILRSIFTHLRPKEVEHYLSQIGRVMKNGGTCFITYHILNVETDEMMKNERSYFNFGYNVEGHCFTTDLNLEPQVAYEESYIREIYQENGLKIKEPILYGGWRRGNNPSQADFQDIVVAYK